jgi:hypothetical protein
VLVGLFLGGNLCAQATPSCKPILRPVGKLLIDDYSILPETGAAWNEVLKDADAMAPEVHVFDGHNRHDTWTLANAFAWKRGRDVSRRDKAADGIRAFYGDVLSTDLATEDIIGACRNALPYVIAMDIMLTDPGMVMDATDRSFFIDALTTLHDANQWGGSAGCKDGTMSACHDLRANNHGTFCGASIIAIEQYLAREVSDPAKKLAHRAHLCERKNTYRGFIGDVDAYDGFKFGDDVSWHEAGQPMRPVGRKNATIGTLSIDGCLADDMRRVGDGPATPRIGGLVTGTDPAGCDDNEPDSCYECGFQTGQVQGGSAGHCRSFPDCFDPYRDSTGAPAATNANRTGYPWEAMQGLVMQAHLLSRSGWPSFAWQSRAIERATRFLYVVYGQWAQDNRTGVVCQAGGGDADDTWVPWIVEAHCGSDFLQDSFWTSGRAPLEVGKRPGKNFGFAEWWTRGL